MAEQLNVIKQLRKRLIKLLMRIIFMRVLGGSALQKRIKSIKEKSDDLKLSFRRR